MSKVLFNNRQQQFYPAVKRAVEAYFQSTGLKRTGNWKLYSKTLLLLPSALFLYGFLLLVSYASLAGIVSCLLLGFILALIGFNIMHDACHGSYSSRPWVNEVMGYTMNCLGANGYIWKIKHNIIHHTYTNIDGVDDDIAKSPFIRQCASQRWVPAHRYQHLYMFVLYGVNTILWVFITDPIKYFSRKITATPIRISLREHVIFWISKILYVVFYIALPVVTLGWQQWLVGYLLMNAAFGLTLSFVFQLAHVVEKTSFETATDDVNHIDSEWAVHELKTTANFATTSPVVSWLVGGLNFKIEHHLFPRVSHIHYPAISKLVRQECEKFGLPYHHYSTMLAAVQSHIRTMRLLGQKEVG
jgi:linoleoyl-CoA desaturase